LTALQQRANGSLRPVEAAVTHAADWVADRRLEAGLREAGENTYDALQALLPPPAAPPPVQRPGFWRRLWAWLCRLWRGFWKWLWFWRRRAVEVTIAPSPRPVPLPPRSSASWRAELTAVERHRLQLGRLELTLALELEPNPDANRGDTGSDSPFEWVLGDLPELRDRAVVRCAPSDGELAWALVRALPAATVVGDESHIEALSARCTAVYDGLLKLDRRPRLLTLEDYRAILDRMAEVVGPLYCGAGARVRRLLLLPPRLIHAYDASGYEKTTGADEEIVFLAVQAGITLRSITSGEDHEDEQATSCPAPARLR
jgi:hypothetical protein